MTKEPLTDKWINYPWSPNQNLDHLIHPDDLKDMKGQGIGIVLCLEDIEEEFIKIKSKSFIIRVKRSGVNKILPPPAFIWNQEVKLKSKPFLKFLVNDFFWHHKDEKYYYQLVMGEKMDKKGYGEEDLEQVS